MTWELLGGPEESLLQRRAPPIPISLPLLVIDFEHLPHLEPKIALCDKMMMLHLR